METCTEFIVVFKDANKYQNKGELFRLKLNTFPNYNEGNFVWISNKEYRILEVSHHLIERLVVVLLYPA